MRRIWLVLSVVGLMSASALAQGVPNDTTKKNTQNDTKGNASSSTSTGTEDFASDPKANRQSDPRAINFLKTKVDKAMYNLVSHGVKDAVIRMKLENSPEFGDLTVIHYWQNSPWQEYTDVEGLSKDMTSFKAIVANQLGDHIRRALLLPASSEHNNDILSIENDGEFVKVTAESREPKDNEKRCFWYTSDGRLVRGVVEGSNPVTGSYEKRVAYDLERVGNQYLVKTITTRLEGRPTQVRLSYEDKGEFKVLRHAIVNSPKGTMSTTFDISLNAGINPKVFSANQTNTNSK
jgi:hypothetical protein